MRMHTAHQTFKINIRGFPVCEVGIFIESHNRSDFKQNGIVIYRSKSGDNFRKIFAGDLDGRRRRLGDAIFRPSTICSRGVTLILALRRDVGEG